MFVKIFETVDFGQNFEKNIDFGQNFRKSRYCSIFAKILNLVEIFGKFRFWSIFLKNHKSTQIVTKLTALLKIWILIKT